jgi:hypothetical protein
MRFDMLVGYWGDALPLAWQWIKPDTWYLPSHRRSPTGSCMGGFRTPDGIRKPCQSQPEPHDDPDSGRSVNHVGGNGAPMDGVQSNEDVHPT